tara:strand:- start:679 stop:3552 length:2874 start_codon:yes stop_codon:yes gene_type:complete
MENPIIPDNEFERLAALESYQILDTDTEVLYDQIIELASYICKTPIALITFIDQDRQWFKAKKGVKISETDRNISFCAHAINSSSEEVFEVSDTHKDSRFKNNPLVQYDPKIRFYGGAPIEDEDGFKLGTLCVLDQKNRVLNQEQKDALLSLASQVSTLLKLKRVTLKSQKESHELSTIFNNLTDVVYELNEKGEYIYINKAIENLYGYKVDELIGEHFSKLIAPDNREKVLEFYKKQFSNKKSYSEYEFKIISKDGKTFWVSQKVSMIFNTKGELDRTVIIARNISAEKRNKTLLIKRTNLLQNVVSNMAEGVIVFDEYGKIALFNDSAKTIFNSSNNDKLSTIINSYHYFEEDKQNKVTSESLPTSLVLKGEFVKNKILYIENKINKELHFYLQINAQPVLSNSGNIKGGVMVIANITAQKEKEYEILKQNSLLEQAKELATIGHWEVDLKKESLFWSNETKRIHEVSSDFIPNVKEAINFYDDESKPKIQKALDRAINEKIDWDEKLKIKTAKGNLKWVRSIGTTISNNNEVSRVFGVFQDITKDKVFEERLLKSEKEVKLLNTTLEKRIAQRTNELENSKKMFQELYDGVPDMLLSINPNTGVILECNETTSKTLGYNKSDIIGEKVIKFYDPSCHHKVKDALSTIKRDGIIDNIKLQIVTKSGKIIPIRLNASVEKDKKGNILRTNSTWRDISRLEKAELDLKKLNQELEQRIKERTKELTKANQEIQEFAYITSHDLKSPLANIDGFTQLLKREIESGNIPLLNTFVDHIQQGVKLATKRVDGIVEVAKLGDSSAIEFTIFSLKELIENSIALLGAKFENPKEIIKVEFNQIDQIKSNQYYFETIISNLLSNAIKYKKEEVKPNILLELFQDNKHFIITIKDNGIGIDLSRGTDKIFGMFTRMHDHVEGSGLGLHITKKMVENLNGTISVQSEKNIGTTFTIKFPRIMLNP